MTRFQNNRTEKSLASPQLRVNRLQGYQVSMQLKIGPAVVCPLPDVDSLNLNVFNFLGFLSMKLKLGL